MMSCPACAGVRILRSVYTTRGDSARSHGFDSMIPSFTASSRALCNVRHALPAVALLRGLRGGSHVSSPLVMYSSIIRKCFGSSLPNRTPPIAGLINASATLLYVANVEGRRRGLTISSNHLSNQSFRYGVVWLGMRPERSYSSFLSFNRFIAMALVRPRATRRRRFPVAGSGGNSHVARYPPVRSG